MLPSLSALPSVVPVGAVDDVITEILAERRAVATREGVLENEDLIREVLLALDDGGSSWEGCGMVARWCSLNKGRLAQCENGLWEQLGVRIWGEQAMAASFDFPVDPRIQFRNLCESEHFLRTHEIGMIDLHPGLWSVERFVRAGIAGGDFRALEHAPDAMRDDLEMVRAAVAADPRAIRFASERTRALVEPVLAPTQHWPRENATPFQLRFYKPVLNILLQDDLENLTLRTVKERLSAQMPELPDDFWVANTARNKRLLNGLLNIVIGHMLDQDPPLA